MWKKILFLILTCTIGCSFQETTLKEGANKTVTETISKEIFGCTFIEDICLTPNVNNKVTEQEKGFTRFAYDKIAGNYAVLGCKIRIFDSVESLAEVNGMGGYIGISPINIIYSIPNRLVYALMYGKTYEENGEPIAYELRSEEKTNFVNEVAEEVVKLNIAPKTGNLLLNRFPVLFTNLSMI